MRSASRRPIAAAFVVAAAVAGVSAPAASARPWTANYPWQTDTTVGYENWVTNEGVPGSGAPGPFYRVFRGDAPANPIGRGLAVQPLGGRIYDNGDPSSQFGGPGTIVRWAAPGQSRITSAQFDGLRYRNENDGQYLRLRLNGATAAGTETRDYGPAYNQDDPAQTYSLPAETLTPNGGGVAAETWLYTVCAGNAGAGFTCPNVSSATGTFGRVGSVRLTLDDPDVPTVTLDVDPSVDSGFVRKRRTERLTVTGADASSGISRIRVQATNGAGTGGASILDQQVTCDRLHRTSGRGGLNCPATSTVMKTDPASAQGRTGRTYTVTAWDDAGNQSAPLVKRIRYDENPPKSLGLSGAITRLTDWTNKRGVVQATLRGVDSLSGIQQLSLQATRRGTTRPIVLGEAAVDCSDQCVNASAAVGANLDLLNRDGEYRLSVRAVDRVGNTATKTVSSKVRIDTTPPKRSGRDPFYVFLPNGRIRVYFQPGRDPQDGAGIGNVVVRYTTVPSEITGQAEQRVRSFAVTDAPAVTVGRSPARYRTVTLQNVDTTQPIDATRAGCDRAQYGSPNISRNLGDETGNCSEMVKVSLDDDIPTATSRGTGCDVNPHIYNVNRTIKTSRGRSREIHGAFLNAYVSFSCAHKTGISPATMTFGNATPGNLEEPRKPKKEKIVDGKVRTDRYTSPTFSTICSPGIRTYEVSVVVGLAFSQPGRTGFGAAKGFGGEQHNCNAEGAWQYLAWKTSTPQRASTVLEKNMAARGDKRPSGGGYAAHHVIPTYLQGAARPVERIGYVCNIAPNEAANGVFIPVKVHNRIHNETHWKWVAQQFQSALRGNGVCNGDQARKILARVKSAVRAGTAGGMTRGGAGEDADGD